MNETAIPPALPPQAFMRSGGGVSAIKIKKEVLRLVAELAEAGGNLSQARATLAQLRMLSGMAGRAGHKSSQLQGLIGSAMTKVQRLIEQLEEEENQRNAALDPEHKFELLVYGAMSVKAKAFYDAIDEDAHYHIAHINANGEIVHGATRPVDGKTLRQRMRLIKFHSLDTAHKKKILHDTFGAGKAEAEGTPKDKELLIKRHNEMHELHIALGDMEAYKAHMLAHEGNKAAIEENHQLIADAHIQIDEVIARYKEVIANPDDGEAVARLKAAKLKMKHMLKEDVIGHVLLEQPSGTHTVSGGVSTTDVEVGKAGKDHAGGRHGPY